MIHVNRGATSLGAFSEEDVHQGLRAGRFLATDLGWQEGMASWKQLSQFTEFAADVPSSAAPPPPQVGVASTTVPPVAISTAVTNAPRGGLPWEHREERGFFNAFIETLTMVLTKPDQAFNAMKTEGGLVEPLIYALIGGCAGALVSFFFSLLLHGMGLLAGQRDAFTMLAGMGIGAIAFVILIPVFVVLGVFIGAAMIHLSLMIVGGANKSFETTFRVLAFTQGSTGPLQMIPVCGGLIAGIWALIVNCIGLARAHETSTGRAVLAVLLPLILCCGGGCMIAVMIGALAASRH
ncbi:MAG: YIP1 family protein [Verrucomicrobiota bacterium]